MTVQELIERLQTIPNKNLEVRGKIVAGETTVIYLSEEDKITKQLYNMLP